MDFKFALFSTQLLFIVVLSVFTLQHTIINSNEQISILAIIIVIMLLQTSLNISCIHA